MKRIICFYLFFISISSFSWAETSRMEKIKEALHKYTDCQVLVHVYDPSAIEATHLGLCIYEWVETRGIFADRACVVSMIEPETQTRDPFYKKNGHWGVMGNCTQKKIEDLLTKKDTYTTVNPITSVQEKHAQGWRVTLMRDELNLWPMMGSILQQSTPVFPKTTPIKK